MKKICSILLAVLLLCTLLTACGETTPRLDGSYELEGLGTKTVYTFDKQSDLVTIKYFVAGLEVYAQDGTYQINSEETEITLSIPKNSEETTDEDAPDTLLSGTFTFSRGDGYITIGTAKYLKSGAASETSAD